MQPSGPSILFGPLLALKRKNPLHILFRQSGIVGWSSAVHQMLIYCGALLGQVTAWCPTAKCQTCKEISSFKINYMHLCQKSLFYVQVRLSVSHNTFSPRLISCDYDDRKDIVVQKKNMTKKIRHNSNRASLWVCDYEEDYSY